MKKIVLILLLSLTVIFVKAQLQVTIAASKTELKDNAITIGLTYLRSFDSLFGDQEHFIPGKKSFFLITPELDIQTGTADAFSSITAKATGLISTFKTTTVAGLTTPDFNKTFHVFPVSIGAETNNLFNNINGIFEVGWIPYYQSYGRSSPDWVKKTNFGIFLQAGYKFGIDSMGRTTIGGEIDKSEERPDRGILRAKGEFGINTGELLTISGLKIGLVANAEGWYDALNSAVYHKLEGRARFFLNATQYVDLLFSKGSGAPLFNQAFQAGVGLTLSF